MSWNENGKYTCHYNIGCECSGPDCDDCGWNPTVAARRLKNYKENHNMLEKKYKIPFTGYCEVYAKSEKEALEKADRDERFYAKYDYHDPVCEEDEDEEDDYELD